MAESEGKSPTLGARLGRSLFLYSAASLLQRAIAFLLLPLYTLYLSPADYGILSVALGISGVVAIFSSSPYLSAVTRFYFEHRDDPEALRRFWGSTLTFTMLLSWVVVGGVMWVGPWILAPLLGKVPFWPFLTLALASLLVQPFAQAALSMFQVREQPIRYVLFSGTQFLCNLVLVLLLVVGLRWGAEGSLLATLLSGVMALLLAWVLVREDLSLGMVWDDVKRVLAYGLPLVPYMLVAQLSVQLDKFFLNRLVDPATAGLYSVAFMLASVLAIVADSVNRAYVPVYMDAMKRDEDGGLAQVAQVGLLLVWAYAVMALVVGLFAPEIFWLCASASFSSAATVLPTLALAACFGGVYPLFSNVFFFVPGGTRFTPIVSVVGLAASLVGNLVLIPLWGMKGAAWATLGVQGVMLLTVCALGFSKERVPWARVRMFTLLALAAAGSLAGGAWLNTLVGLQALAAKAGLTLLLTALLGAIAWGNPLYPIELLRPRVLGLLGKK